VPFAAGARMATIRAADAKLSPAAGKSLAKLVDSFGPDAVHWARSAAVTCATCSKVVYPAVANPR